jgi:hypothetical protein
MTTGCWQGCSDSTSSKYGEHAPRMILCACADPGYHQKDSFVGNFVPGNQSFDFPLQPFQEPFSLLLFTKRQITKLAKEYGTEVTTSPCSFYCSLSTNPFLNFCSQNVKLAKE